MGQHGFCSLLSYLDVGLSTFQCGSGSQRPHALLPHFLRITSWVSHIGQLIVPRPHNLVQKLNQCVRKGEKKRDVTAEIANDVTVAKEVYNYSSQFTPWVPALGTHPKQLAKRCRLSSRVLFINKKSIHATFWCDNCRSGWLPTCHLQQV